MKLTTWQRLRSRAFMFMIGVRRRMTLGCRAVLIDGDRVFLIRQTYMPGWQFCGGGVEPGETAEYAAGREMLEETGYRASGPLQLFGFYHNPSSYTDRDYVALYLCRDFEQVRQMTANNEIAESGWFPHDALPADTDEGTRRRIAEIFGSAPASATW